MRPIKKFRGITPYNSKWVEGNLLVLDGYTHIIPSDILEMDGHHLRIDCDTPTWIDPESLCEYVDFGNSVGCYTYDRIELETEYSLWYGIVEYDSKLCAYKLVNLNNGDMVLLSDIEPHLCDLTVLANTKKEDSIKGHLSPDQAKRLKSINAPHKHCSLCFVDFNDQCHEYELLENIAEVSVGAVEYIPTYTYKELIYILPLRTVIGDDYITVHDMFTISYVDIFEALTIACERCVLSGIPLNIQ